MPSKKIILPRQTSPYTCGPTSLSIVGKLLGRPFHEYEIVKEINVTPRKGVDHNALTGYACDHFPVGVSGENSYHGGLAIANIKNPSSHNGHFVVLLGEKDGVIRYYCPFFGEVVEKKREDILWEDGSGELKNWSVSFNAGDDFYALEAEAEPHIFILADSMDRLLPELDTSLLLMQTYSAHDQSVSWHTAKDIFTRGKMLYLSGIPVLKNDMVWMRCNPLNTVQYYEMLRRLCSVEATILNPPQAILNFHDKLSTLKVDDNINSYTASTREAVEYAVQHLIVDGYRRFVIKTPSRFGGRGVFLANTVEEALGSFDKMCADSGYVIVQGYISTGDHQVDRQVLVTQRVILGGLDRSAGEGGFLCGLASGGKPDRLGALTKRQQDIVQSVQRLMKQEGIFLAGLDFLNDELIEINVTCPSTVPYIKKLDNPNVDMDLIHEAEAYVGGKKT